MRFLVDTCAGRLLAEWLRAEGHDVVRVTDSGADPGDSAVLRRAVGEGRILVTMDKDFGMLIHRDRMRHAGIIRLPHTTVAERIDLVRTILHRFTEADLDGALLTVRGTRIRIARRVR
ncbi:MAG: DUF5615 family PIN-like protein [Geminicoccaceae bacterium]